MLINAGIKLSVEETTKKSPKANMVEKEGDDIISVVVVSEVNMVYGSKGKLLLKLTSRKSLLQSNVLYAPEIRYNLVICLYARQN
ncbi:hypothetical protein WN944_013555 [Citrus x changshan-huyou]|uniref:Uncharacterized protein n=1 Tax=Citrus x changshan-huyou TaxID=2935761 RepID=A0AAP0M890_9ROSI